jgi:hypothetical protein
LRFAWLLGTVAILALAAGIAKDLAGSSTPEPTLAEVTARLSHVRIAPRNFARSTLASRSAAATPARPIIGTNDGTGWGAKAARKILAGHITWNRVAVDEGGNLVAESRTLGFKVLGVVGNVLDEMPLSRVEPKSWGAEVVSELQTNRGISIAEAGNESYFKDQLANPVQYGRMYLDAVEDMKAAHIQIPLLFNMTGDIPLHTWAHPDGWSEDAKGGGWLREAVQGVPGLARAILANGISIHPYGALGENTHDDWGISAAAADEAVAKTVLGAIPPFYVTEIGYAIGRCGISAGACSTREQASKLQAAYEVFLADPDIAGIWWYQSHDDPTGNYGFMSAQNVPRLSFKVLAGLAAAVGQ